MSPEQEFEREVVTEEETTEAVEAEVVAEESSTTSVRARQEQVRDLIENTKNRIETGYADLAQLLHEAWSGAYHIAWGYSTFNEYCDQELGMKPRKARYFVAIAEAVSKLGVNWNDVVHIGWRKLAALTPVLTSDNYNDWISRAEEHTVDQITEMVKRNRSGEEIDSDSESPRVFSMQLRMNDDEHTVISEAIETAKRQIESEAVVPALEHICYQYMQQEGDGETRIDLDAHLTYIERTFGVKCAPVENIDLNTLEDGGEE